MFLVPAWVALTQPQMTMDRHFAKRDGPWILMLVLLTLLVGYRNNVGADWDNYLANVLELQGETLVVALSYADPGYQLASWLSLKMGWGIFGVNLFCGLLFATGLIAFCRTMPCPWLALAISVPYLVIVVAMGYSRQAVALGFAMMGLTALGRRRVAWFVVWIAIGAMFHKSAVLLLPLGALAASGNRIWTAFWIALLFALSYLFVLEDSAEVLYVNFVEAEYQSGGALIRLLMNAVPAAVLLIWHRRYNLRPEETLLWIPFAAVSICLLAALPLSPSSAALDRMALYLLPLQVMVFSRAPVVFGRANRSNWVLVAAVLAYYAGVLFVWLNFAQHAELWIPYRFYPLEAWW